MRAVAAAVGKCVTAFGLVALAAVALLPVSAAGQAQRDPTQAPAAPSAGTPGGGEKAAQSVPMAVIVRDGRPYVVAGTRLVAQGQMLGDARVERISETEIWLREGKSLRKVPRYAGIQRKALP